MCPLCNRDVESTEHFLLRCDKLQRVWDPFVLLLESSVNTTGRDWTGEDMVQLILDPSILLSWCKVEDNQPLISCSQSREAFAMPCIMPCQTLCSARWYKLDKLLLMCGVYILTFIPPCVLMNVLNTTINFIYGHGDSQHTYTGYLY